MSKVITFSRAFPKYHPKAGQPTYFVEKLLKGFPDFIQTKTDLFSIIPLALDKFVELSPKYHTIRSGHRWKVGDKFSPRVWSSKPYHSKQIIIAPDIEIVKAWDFKMKPGLWLDECFFFINESPCGRDRLKTISVNDGLEYIDFIYWFSGQNIVDSKRKPFDGQIICWSDSISYDKQQNKLT